MKYKIDWENWTPTSENINALPGKLKAYVHGLESMCDPAGIITENTLLRDEAMLLATALIKERRYGS